VAKLIIIKLLKMLMTKLVTETVMINVFLHVAEYLSQKTENTLDDKLVNEIKKALNHNGI
jgi:uncharacterized protein YbgA (DUF1722 family)